MAPLGTVTATMSFFTSTLPCSRRTPLIRDRRGRNAPLERHIPPTAPHGLGPCQYIGLSIHMY